MATGRPRGSPGWPLRRARPRVGRRPSRAARLFVSEALSRHPPSSLIVPPTPADIARHGLTVVVAVTDPPEVVPRTPPWSAHVRGPKSGISRTLAVTARAYGTLEGRYASRELAMSTHVYGLTVNLLADASRAARTVDHAVTLVDDASHV